MSLKGFHILFIMAALLLLIGVGVWAFTLSPVGEYFFLGGSSLVGALVLMIYLPWFLRKADKLNLGEEE